MSTALTEFVELLGGAIVTLAQKIAQGVSEMASALFLKINSTTQAVEGLSVFGGIMGIFCGVSLARKTDGEVKSRNIGGGFNTNTEISIAIS